MAARYNAQFPPYPYQPSHQAPPNPTVDTFTPLHPPVQGTNSQQPLRNQNPQAGAPRKGQCPTVTAIFDTLGRLDLAGYKQAEMNMLRTRYSGLPWRE